LVVERLSKKKHSQQDVEEVAASLRSYAAGLFLKVSPSEFQHMNWEKNKEACPNLNNLTEYSNMLSNRVSADILHAGSKAHQQRIYDFYLEVAKEAYNNHDYYTAQAIFNGVNQTPVSRLID